MDVILYPAGPGVAPSHNTAKYWSYTSRWNFLNYPAVVFPVTKSDKNVDRQNKYKLICWISYSSNNNLIRPVIGVYRLTSVLTAVLVSASHWDTEPHFWFLVCPFKAVYLSF